MIKKNSINILYLIIFFILYYNLYAQEISEMKIKSKPTLQLDQIIDKNIHDSNGEICAGLIIISSLEGLTYNSDNNIVKTNRNPGSDFLFLSPSEQTVTIYKTGYVPFKLILNEIGIKLKSGDVWKIEITGDKFLNVGKGDFLIESLPAGAVIKIDGIPTFNEKTPFLLKEFNAQKYKITLSKDEYVFIDTTITITKDKRGNLLAKLEPKYGYITVDSEYSDFDLYIDNRLVEYNNNSPFKLSIGSHKVKVVRKYFKEIEEEIFIKPNDNQSQSLVLKPNYEPIYRNIFISSEPNNAEVYINGEYIGVTPINKIFKAGIYSLKLFKENYREEFKNIEVYKNDLVEEIKLSKKGYLNILGTEGASIFINQKYIGAIPLRGLLVDPSDYNIRVVKDGCDSEERIVTISSETIDLEINLAETTGKFFRFGLFGNERLASIFSGGGIFYKYIPLELNEQLMNSLTFWGEKHKLALDRLGLSYTLYPVVFSASLSRSNDEIKAGNIQNDSLDILGFGLSLSIIPFAFFETVYPSISLEYNSFVLQYLVVNDAKKTEKQSFFVYSLDLNVKLYKNLFINIGISNSFDNNYSFPSINMGIGTGYF